MSVCLKSVSLSVCLSVCVSVCLYVSVFCLSVCLSMILANNRPVDVTDSIHGIHIIGLGYNGCSHFDQVQLFAPLPGATLAIQ